VGCGFEEWIGLAQDRDRWRALVSAVRNLRENIWAQERRGNGEWRKLHNDELNGLYSLPNIVRVIKSRRLSRAGHVARMGEG
jgi:hypothetical protein